MTHLPPDLRLATFTDRLLARIVDALVYASVSCVLSVPAGIAALIVAATVPTPPSGNPAHPYDPDLTRLTLPLLSVLGVLIAALALFSYLYEVELPLRTGHTLGKRVLRLQVTSLGTLGVATVTRAALTKRFFCLGLCGSIAVTRRPPR